MLAKAEQQDQNSDHPSPPKMNRYTEFIEMEEEKISTEFIKKSCHSINKSTLPRFVNTYISNIKHIVLLYLCTLVYDFRAFLEDCHEIDENFESQRTILSSLHNGRLGNQMSSFATLFAFHQLGGEGFRIGITTDQYQTLSSIFPFFEKNAKKILIEALHCDSACAKIRWTPLPLAKMHLESKDQWQLLITETTSKMGHGYALDLGVYINYPVIYQNYLGILRGEIFQIKKEYQDQAIEIINDIKKTKTIDEELNVKHFNLIGVHARYTDYKYHLKQRGGQYLKPTFFIKAMNYFRQKYENPLFLLVSDEVPKAKKIIIDSQPEYQDIVFVGTIDDAIDGKMSREESMGVDLAIMSLCQHVIMTHGTFGLWSTFLSSLENEHIVADDYIKPLTNPGQDKLKPRNYMEELIALKNANFSNYIFMNDH